MRSPFVVETNHDPVFLQAEAGDRGEVILERDGVHYINDSIFTPDRETEEHLDNDFKNLVASVIK